MMVMASSWVPTLSMIAYTRVMFSYGHHHQNKGCYLVLYWRTILHTLLNVYLKKIYLSNRAEGICSSLEQLRNMLRFARRKELYQSLVKIVVIIIDICIPINADCVTYDFSESTVGYYCPHPGTILHNMVRSQCLAVCLQSVNCEAFNHNSTDKSCTLFTTSCSLATCDPLMEYIVLRQKPSIDCYEWTPYVAADPIDGRVVRVREDIYGSYVSRYLVNGDDDVGFLIHEHAQCYSCLGSLRYIGRGNFCQLLRISPSCTSLWVPYKAGDILPERAIIGGRMTGESHVWIARFSYHQDQVGGYYTTGSTHGVARYGNTCITPATMEILILV